MTGLLSFRLIFELEAQLETGDQSPTTGLVQGRGSGRVFLDRHLTNVGRHDDAGAHGVLTAEVVRGLVSLP